MSNEGFLKAALYQLISMDEHRPYYENYVADHEIKTTDDLDKFFMEFKNHLISNGKWDNKLDLTLKIIKEQSDSIKLQKSSCPTFFVDISRKLNDGWVSEFLLEFKNCQTGDKYAKEIIPRTYKTITEYLILYSVDTEKLSEVYQKYSQYDHPYVNYSIASVLYNTKNFTQGLPILFNGLNSIITFPTFYWNNEYGVEGAAWLLGDFLFLANKILDQKERIILLKLCFLYLSRYIHMTNSNIKCVDFYSNRARLVRNNLMYFIGIFPMGVNPDLQFISDMYLAHQTGLNHDLPMFIKPFDQFYWDSMKMYRHGSLIPNNTGGYQEIEEKTWMEIVQIGELRSIELTESLFNQFKNKELNIPKIKLEQIYKELIETSKDDTESFLKDLQNKKLSE